MVPGQQIGRYRLERELGKGGMGVVFLAHDTVLHRPVAVKGISVPAHDPETADLLSNRIFKEARTVAALSHPGIIPIYDVVMEDSGLFLVMEYVDGETLTEYWKRDVAIADRFSILSAVAAALDYAHAHGIIHRDVKPGNIMVTRETQPKLADFGIAKILGSDTQTTRGLILGTLEFMAPEQIKGEDFDGKVDQFALAVVAYRFLTGHRVFESTDAVTMSYKICHEQPLLPSVHSPWLCGAADQVLLKALAKEPRERFDTCVDFVYALHDACTPLSKTEKQIPTRARSTVGRSVPPEPPQRGAFLKSARLLAGLAALCIAAVIAVWLLSRYPQRLWAHWPIGEPKASTQRTPSPSPPSTPVAVPNPPVATASNSAPAGTADKPVTSNTAPPAPAAAPKSPSRTAPKATAANLTDTSHQGSSAEARKLTGTAAITKTQPASQPSPAALLQQAKTLYIGKNYDAALPLFQQAASAGSIEADAYLGSMYLEGHGTVPDFHEALTRFRGAADAGDARGLIGMGFLYEFGKGVPPNYGRAMQYYRQAADAHSGAAMFDVGRLYEYGKGVPRDYAAALEWYRKAADAGVSEAMNNLGVLYENGWGVPKSKSEALRWYLSAADAGNAHGQANLHRLTASN